MNAYDRTRPVETHRAVRHAARNSITTIIATMGHEMGHYVLHHLCKGIAFVLSCHFRLLGRTMDLRPRPAALGHHRSRGSGGCRGCC
jgi:hypothetical protein